MEDNEALEIYCRRMITQVNNKLKPETGGETGWRESQEKRTAPRGRGRQGLQSETWRRMIIQIHRKQNTETTAVSERRERQKEKIVMRQRESEDLAGEPVPLQLISALKMKTFTEEMRRAMDTELHDPSVCGVCVQQQAALSLNTFIRRKTTQLDTNTLEDKLHTHLYNRDAVCLLGELLRGLPKPSDAPSRIWEQLQARGRQQLGVTLETEQESGCTQTRERQSGVTLTTIQ
ncbi:uncharacterized protein LOC115167971 [Salmo trutta]|uniref:Uncharacterized LOC115167971 n=1 Tax=Salmo trutta TaxID=8032 RepID=A0A673VVV6_SALTR|nr:uncharacterized protein LOC115167971 [Salmo trutta]XP_029578643.1 uncharacterized protein LOC115167971 [Salmo trutta]XP_029578651.1 uncharacterized protein LOC115167971 [Salmo trutta]